MTDSNRRQETKHAADCNWAGCSDACEVSGMRPIGSLLIILLLVVVPLAAFPWALLILSYLGGLYNQYAEWVLR